jgi:hypothetical protein
MTLVNFVGVVDLAGSRLLIEKNDVDPNAARLALAI